MTTWNTIDNHHIEKTVTFKNFIEALAFTNKVGDLAEQHNHHPEITLTWGLVIIKIWTHSENAITPKDHTLAAAIDTLK